MQERLLTFVVPLRAPAASKNWERVLERLAETVRSIDSACKETPGLGAVLVVNREAELPPLPSCFEVIRVDLPPPGVSIFKGESADHERRDAVNWDKGLKVLTGMRHAQALSSRFVMSVDADDLVSRFIAKLPKESPESNGWLIDEGWLLPVGGKWGMTVDDFHNWCGTYAIVRTNLLPLERGIEENEPEVVKRIFGNHRHLAAELEEKGLPLQMAGYPAAIYSVGHSESNFGREGLARSMFAPEKFVENPRKYIKRLTKLRYFSSRYRFEFSIHI